MYIKYKCSDCFDEFIKIDNFTNEDERMLFFIKEFDKYYPEGFMVSLEVYGNGVENYIEIPEESYYLIKKNQSMLLRSIWGFDRAIILVFFIHLKILHNKLKAFIILLLVIH